MDKRTIEKKDKNQFELEPVTQIHHKNGEYYIIETKSNEPRQQMR